MDSENFKNMALMFAIGQKNHPAIERWINEEADPNFVYPGEVNGNCTPLHTAVSAKDPVSIRILLRSGARHDTANNNGISPWDMAQPYPELKAVFEQHLGLNLAEPLAAPVEQPESRNLKYDRRPGTSGMSGQLYEVDLLGLVLNRLRKGGYEFLVGTNIDEIGEFDDLCIRYRKAGENDYKFIFLQAKHRDDPEKKKITTELLTLQNRGKCKQYDDYSIYKLFSSYLKTRKRFQNDDNEVFFTGDFESSDIELILYTNAKSDCESVVSIQCNDLLNTSANGKGLQVLMNNEIKCNLCQMLSEDSNKNVFAQMCSRESIQDVEGFKHKLAEDYIKKLKIYCDQGNAKDVGNVLENELQDSRTLYLMYHDLVREYWLSASEYLTESCQFLEDAKQNTADKLLESFTSICSRDAKSYQLEYSEEAFECLELDAFLENPNEKFLNIHSKVAFLSFVKVSQYFEQRSSESLVIIDFAKVYHEWKTIEAKFLDLNKFNIMIVYCVEKKSQFQKTFINIGTTKGNKKIIIVSDEPLSGFNPVLDSRNSLAYLTLECQTKIMDSKKISFQNKSITLADLMTGVDGQLERDFISGEILLNTLQGDTVEIAKLSAEHVPYFIKRRYVIDINDLKSYENSISIDSVDSFKNRIVIIAAEPGMGKSTILTHLSSNLDFLWFVRFNLLDYCKQLGKIYKNQSKLKMAIEFILGTLKMPQEIFKIFDRGLEQNHEQRSTLNDLKRLEAKVFKSCYNLGKIIVFADGFDEIAPHYVEAALHILQGLKESKIRKLIVTTRNTTAKNVLEKGLGVDACYLCPFRKDEVEEFCKKYWMSNLNITELDEDSTSSFCSFLVYNCTESISTDGYGFIGVPLHIEMIARCVQNTFEKYHRTGGRKYLKELESEMNIVSLYRTFIKTKYDEIYCTEKLKTDPASPQNLISAEELQKKHERLALYALFQDEELEILLPEYKSIRVYDINSIKDDRENKGFVTRVVDDKPQFTHLTFAEFFAAGIIWKTFKETSFEQFETFMEIVLIENLLKSDRKQFFLFLIELARQNSTNFVDKSMKITLLIKRIMALSNTKCLGLVLRLVYCCFDTREFWQYFDKFPKSFLWSLFKLCAGTGTSEILKAMNGRISQTKLKNKLAKREWNQSPLYMTIVPYSSITEILVNEFGYDMRWQDRRNRTLITYLQEKDKLSEIYSLVQGTFTINQILGENISTQTVEAIGRSDPLKLLELNKYIPNISWYLLNSSYYRISSDVGFSQIFFFEYCSRHDSVYHNDDYFDKLLRPELFTLINEFYKVGDGFYLEIIGQIQKRIVILNAISFELENSRSIILAWLEFIIAEANEVSLKVEENGKIKISTNNKHIDVTRWIVEPENILSSSDIEYIKRTLNLPSDSKVTEHFKSLMSEITENNAEDLFFRFLSSSYSMDMVHLYYYQIKFFQLLERLIELQDKYSNLMASIDRGETEVLAELEKITDENERKMVINCRDKKFGSPLLYATACQKLEIARALLNREFFYVRGIPNSNIRLELVNDASFDDLDDVFSKVKEFGNVTPLHIAAFLGDLEFVKFLHSKGASLDASTPYTPLHLAAREGHEDVVRYFLDKGARIDAVVDEDNCEEIPFPVRNREGGRSTPLSLAEKYGHQSVVELLKSFQPTEENGFTALHRAAAANDLDSTRILIQAGGVDINSVTNYNGYTPLHVAADYGHQAIAYHLLRKGANKDAKSIKGKTPEDVAWARDYRHFAGMIRDFEQSDFDQTFEPDYKKVMDEEEEEQRKE